MRIGVFELHELVLVGAGLCMLLSVPLIAFHGIFTWWYIAKGLYLVGVVAMLASFCIQR